jgi:hypothetical protein
MVLLLFLQANLKTGLPANVLKLHYTVRLFLLFLGVHGFTSVGILYKSKPAKQVIRYDNSNGGIRVRKNNGRAYACRKLKPAFF